MVKRTETRAIEGATPAKMRRALQVGPGHGPAKVPDAWRRRRQRRTKWEQERQLQALSLHRRGGCYPPLATRGNSYAPRPEQAPRMNTNKEKRR
jgi:hypothetical protein